MQQRAIPVVVLSGFLGSGKTTLLIRLLQHAQSNGLRASVLMNEIGAVDVDGTQVSSESGNELMERITEGCLCCSKKSELALCLERLVLMQPDLIVIELTGVAESGRNRRSDDRAHHYGQSRPAPYCHRAGCGACA